MQIIPAIDLRGGRCVRLLRGEFDAVTDYSDDALAIACSYADLGCSLIHVVDLDGAETGDQSNLSIVETIVRDSGTRVQIGGGIRSKDKALALLNAGAERIVVGSLALSQADEIRQWFGEFGAEKLVLALDVRIDGLRGPLITTHGWQRDSAVTIQAAIEMYQPAGLRHVLCTDVARDGAMEGPNLELYRGLSALYPTVEFQASGGVRDIDDIEQLRRTGAAAAITGKAMLEGRISPEEIRAFLLDG